MHGSARCLPVLAAIAAVVLVATPGCTRHFYRQYADKDVEGVITQKNIFPNWLVQNWHVYPDPRARFADPFNPDRPPYPPDDYAARLVSPNPQRPTRRSGVGRVDGTGYLGLLQEWDAANRAAEGAAGGVAPPPNPGAPPTNAPGAPGGANDSSTRPLPAPTVVEGDRPAVRHAIPSGFPGGLHPAEGSSPASQSQSMPAGKLEFGPWSAPKPFIMPGPVVTDRGNGPTITELRQPVILVGGEVDDNGNPVPAIAIVPIQRDPKAPPEPLPPPQPLPQPQPLPLPLPKGGEPVVPATPDFRTQMPVQPERDYLRALETQQTGYRLTLEQAIALGILNAREFQDRREDLYLAALPVTLERFNFAAMGFFTQQATLQSLGRNLNNGGERWNLSSSGGINKLFPTGALLMVKLANQVVIDLSGNKPTTTVGNLSLSLMQPFLRGGGLAVTLEPLTLAERNLLYAIRSYARFRKLFFVAVAAGGQITNNPYSFQGLAVNLGRGIGGNLTAPSVGFLQLLLLRAVVNNQRNYVQALERLLRLYQAFREGGQQSPLQVGQVEVQMLTARGSLLGTAGSVNGGGTSGIRGYLDQLDNFKLQLGLPLTVGLDLDDAPLKPIRDQLARFDELFAQSRAMEVEASRYSPTEPVGDFRKRWMKLFTTSPLVQGTAFAKTIEKRWAAWSPGTLTEDQVRARLSKLREDRRKVLDARVERELKKLPEPPAEVQRLAQLTAEIELGEFELRVREFEAQPWLKRTGKERALLQDSMFTAAFNSFFLVVLEAQNERLAGLYASWPKLLSLPINGVDALASTLDEAYTVGIQAALTDRLDLKNARGQVVDAWRGIAVTANSLRGVFNVEYDLNSVTAPNGNTPLGFSSGRNTNQLVFNAQLPLVRRAQRNNYRAALITYQRQRRTLMAFEDNIANDVRGDLRQLRTIAELYRIQQRVVELGYAQVDNAQATLFAPPVPGAGSDAGSAAALTNQVLQNQNNLLNAQNNLYQYWVSYLTARMQLYVDLEVMQLDENGVWSDELYNRSDNQTRPDDQRPGERLHAPRPVDDRKGP